MTAIANSGDSQVLSKFVGCTFAQNRASIENFYARLPLWVIRDQKPPLDAAIVATVNVGLICIG